MGKNKQHVLVIRFSAMGDVAMAAPVIRSLAAAYPSLQISMATRPKLGVFFQGIPNVQVLAVDLEKDYQGFGGIFRLFATLRKAKPTLVIDIHDHLRTKLLRFFFSLAGIKTLVFDKGRGEKKMEVRPHDKIRKQLPHTVERYHQVFQKAGFDFPILKGPYLFVGEESKVQLNQWLASKKTTSSVWIGIAPFAAHLSKMWPLEKYREVIAKLSASGSYHFFLFGGGPEETTQLKQLESQFENVTCAAGELKLNTELALIERLSLMICGDSSNMHLASLLNIPVVSIWGGTHPHLGFGPWGQSDEAIVQIPLDELPCRPCSVYGTSYCLRGDFACLTQITPEAVFRKAYQRIS